MRIFNAEQTAALLPVEKLVDALRDVLRLRAYGRGDGAAANEHAAAGRWNAAADAGRDG